MTPRRPPSRKLPDCELSVFDGSICIGHISECANRRTATTLPEERNLGAFPTRKAAEDSISHARRENRNYNRGQHEQHY